MICTHYYTYIGALTSKPYAFKARSWELQSIETIDLFESICSNIKIDIKGSEIARILPLNNKDVNDEWLSDKSRYAYDGLKRWRFIYPMIKKNNSFVQTSWKNVFQFVQDKINNNKYSNIIINTGNFTDLETITALKTFSDKFDNVILNKGDKFNSDVQNYYFDINLNTLNSKIIIYIGFNIRIENPVLNIRLKKASANKNFLLAFIGNKFNNNLNVLHLGNSINVLKKIKQGKHLFNTIIKNFLKKNIKNINIKNYFKQSIDIVMGKDYYNRIKTFTNSLFLTNNSSLKFNYNIIYNSVGRINLLELNFYNNRTFNNLMPNLYYLIGTEYINEIKSSDFVIFQGHHNDKIRLNFHVILPVLNWTEKSSLYINCLGQVQRTNIILNSPKLVRLDWKIVRMISIFFNADIDYTSIKEIHNRLVELTPNIINSIAKYNIHQKYKIHYKSSTKKYIFIDNNPFTFQMSNYYLTNSIERSSKIMLECFNILEKKKNNFI